MTELDYEAHYEPAPDRAALRRRIAEALYDHNHPGWATRFIDLDQDERDTYLARADAVLPEMTGQTTDQGAAEPFPIWTVWREEQPAYGHFATEDIAKQATIDCWEEDEPPCPDYSWRPDGAPGGWELLVGGERAEVYVRRHLVYGGLPQPPRADVLRAAADELDARMERFFSEWPDEPRNSPYALGQKDATTELRRLADETQPTTGPGCWCGHPKSQHWSGAHKYGQELPWLPEGDEAATDTQDAPPVEPHPTEADLRHAMAVLDRFYGRGANEPAPGARQDGAQQQEADRD